MFFKIEVKTRHDQQLWASAKGTDPKMHKPGCYMQKIRGKEKRNLGEQMQNWLFDF